MHHFYQFIVPLAFLAIWALTSLFNREAQPLPPRAGRRPGGPPKPGEWRPESVGRPAVATPTRPTPGRAGQDEIIILETETRRPSTPPASRPAARRPNRGRPSQQQTAARRAEPTPAAKAPGMRHGLTDAAPVGSRTQGLSPLALPPSPLLSRTEGGGSEMVTASSAGSPVMARLSPDGVRSWLQNADRLREAIILNEILQPPITLRRASLRGR